MDAQRNRQAVDRWFRALNAKQFDKLAALLADIANDATPGGSKVSYSMTQLTMSNPLLRLGLPVVRTMSWQLGIPFMAGRGFRNLLAIAETRATSDRLFSEQASRA